VAFTWDVRIRKETNGTRDLGDFFRALLKRTDGGTRGYAWPDLEAALQEVAPGDWAAFHGASIHGRGPIPVEEALADIGQRLIDETTGVRVEADPKASADARRRWELLVGSAP